MMTRELIAIGIIGTGTGTGIIITVGKRITCITAATNIVRTFRVEISNGAFTERELFFNSLGFHCFFKPPLFLISFVLA
jgi:hypothetical protein